MSRNEQRTRFDARRLGPWFALLVLLAATAFTRPATAAEHRLGLGVHYWETVDSLAEGFEIDGDGLTWLVSYQYVPQGLFRFELDLELYDDGFGGSGETAVAPVAFVVVGSGLYVAVGFGVTISSGLEDDVSDPFYAARIGYQFRVLPGLRLDVNANYRTGAFDELDDFATDTVTFGLIARLSL